MKIRKSIQRGEKREKRSTMRLAAYIYIVKGRVETGEREDSSVVYETHTREHILRAVVFSKIEETT